MKVNLKPEIQAVFDTLALEQGMESNDYAAHVLKKYALSQVDGRTLEKFKELPEGEKLAIRQSVKVAYEASRPIVVKPELVEEPIIEEVVTKEKVVK
jgi:hypothetical protein